MEKIYLAEDEKEIREAVKSFLMSEGYQVTAFDNGDKLFECFLSSPCELIILDVIMPGSSGFEITRKIRSISAVPIIILTAKDSDIDYATGINLGSDDYFTKPFSALALVMRVKAMLRRVKLDKSEGISSADEIAFGDMQFFQKSMEVKIKNKKIELTPTEYSLLLYMLQHRDRAISREELLDKIWGYGKDIETRACDDTIRRLRKKIADGSVIIDTVWGFGFHLKERSHED